MHACLPGSDAWKMSTPEARSQRRRLISWVAALVCVVLFTQWRAGQHYDQIRDQGDRIEALGNELLEVKAQLAQTCQDRAVARNVIRTVMLDDPDTSEEMVLRIATEFQDIPCPP